MIKLNPSWWRKMAAVLTWMKTQNAAIASWIQAVAVVVTLVFIAIQIRQQTNLSRAANVQASVGLITPLNLKLTEPEMAKVWVEGRHGWDQHVAPSEEEIRKEQYENLLVTYLVFYENVFSQNQEGLIDNEIYQGWDKDLEAFIKHQRVKEYWTSERKAKYRPEFRKRVDEIIANP